MPKKSSDDFRVQASLSQKVSFDNELIQKLAGSDPATSVSIGFFLKLEELGYINLDEPNWKLVMGLLDVRRQALFATSEKTDIISKLGFMLPAKEMAYYDE
jgi:hypothetical protein